MREDKDLRDTPVILLSARAGEEAKVEGLRAGADDYLTKPFSARELLARVETNLNIARTRRETARLLEEERQVLELLNEVGNAVAAELDLERAVQVVTDAATQLSGAAFGAFFYNVIDDKGESYTLYTLSGVPREAFAKFPMPRNTAVFGPTFSGEGIVRSRRHPQGSALRQERAVPRHAQGPPAGAQLSRGAGDVAHRRGAGRAVLRPSRGRACSTERAERIVAAIAAQAAIAIDKARLYRAAQEEIGRRRKVEEALRENEQMLETKVAERTAELASANADLIKEAVERAHAEGRFQSFVEGVADYAMFMLDPTASSPTGTPAPSASRATRADEIVGRHFASFYTEQDRAAGVPARALEDRAARGQVRGREAGGCARTASTFWASVVINPIRDRPAN